MGNRSSQVWMICQKQWQVKNENAELLTSPLLPKPPQHHSLPFVRKKMLVHASWGRFLKAETIGIFKNTQLRGSLVPRREATTCFSKHVLLHLGNLTFFPFRSPFHFSTFCSPYCEHSRSLSEIQLSFLPYC